MAMTVLQIAEALSLRAGLPKPSSVAGVSSGIPAQTLALMQQAAADMIVFNDWNILKDEHSFTTVAQEVQFDLMATLPTFKSFDADTFINLTRNITMKPANSRQHTAIRLSPSPTPFGLYRILGGNLVLPGNQVAGEQILFEYRSNAWVRDVDTGARKIAATKNTDVVLLDDEALIRGVKWLFKKEKGLAYGEDMNDWLRYITHLKSIDTPREDLSLNTPAATGMSGISNIYIDAV